MCYERFRFEERDLSREWLVNRKRCWEIETLRNRERDTEQEKELSRKRASGEKRRQEASRDTDLRTLGVGCQAARIGLNMFKLSATGRCPQ